MCVYICVYIYTYIYIKDSVFNSAHPSKISKFSIFICIFYVNNPKRFVSVIPCLESCVCLMTIFSFFFFLCFCISWKLNSLWFFYVRFPSRPLGIWQQHIILPTSVSILIVFLWSYVGLFTGCHRCFLPNVCFIWPSFTLVATTLTPNSCFWSVHHWGKSEYQRNTMALSTLTFTS